MDTSKLRKFAQFARTTMIDQVTARIDYVLNTDSAELREKEKVLTELKRHISETSKEALAERIAYTWFNRFCALRFMDVNRYSRIGIVSPAEGNTQPEILAEAKQGHIDERFMDSAKAQIVMDLLSGNRASANAQAEAYRLLLVAVCNHYHNAMPYLFERIEDYTEILLPEDLLSQNSILAYVRESMTPDACENVEVIGWLYQYYISAKKDKVFEDLKKKKLKVSSENIPAATQLFTPHWIVRYLVENSLGRLWMLNHPTSKLIEKMPYYIAPQEVETDFLKVSSPEEIKICDPACGSGHMLTYAFDLLYAIYEEQGYDTDEISEKILKYNLFGIEIDERAGALAAFALSMKAREKSRRFFEKHIEPNICVLQNIDFSPDELRAVREELGNDLLTGPFNDLLTQFKNASNFGSLIIPAPADIATITQTLNVQTGNSRLFFDTALAKMRAVLIFADYLSPKYHVVIANPPYMGGGNMNAGLADFAKVNYPHSKSDLFAMFIERNLKLVQKRGMVAMITMQSWMFLSSFEKLRSSFLDQKTILSMAHLGARAFDSIGGEVVSTTAFVLKNAHHATLKGQYLRLIEGRSEAEKSIDLRKNLPASNPTTKLYFTASAANFKKIPGSPIAYWVSEKIANIFQHESRLESIAPVKVGLQTGSNEIFVRDWFEVSTSETSFGSDVDHNFSKKWFPYNKGGAYRKWYGNNENVVNWENDGREIQNFTDDKGKLRSRPQNQDYYFLVSISWSFVSSSYFGVRFSDSKAIFDVGGSSAFPTEDNKVFLTGLLCSKLSRIFMETMNPTLNFQVGNVASIPVISKQKTTFDDKLGKYLIDTHKLDWNAYETSWDFSILPILEQKFHGDTFEQTYQNLRRYWEEQTLEMQRLEQKNNRIFIDAYGLQDELTPDVPLNEITLTCNPYYRYGGNKTNAELELKLLDDTCQEFIHYAVGCMFGRYSLDKAGLILANQGGGIEDYHTQIPNPIFDADDDNVIPILDDNWFSDDIVERFQKFLRVTFGEEQYKTNLEFIENAIGKSLRKYFTRDFYDYHVRRYKKRPIYWMFSSPKGSFNALIYMHRYKPDTVSIILNDYLRDFLTKLEAALDHEKQKEVRGSASEKVSAIKEIKRLDMIIGELKEWEHEFYTLASRRIEIDLDDGVKVNYPKFGTALKMIKGLADETE